MTTMLECAARSLHASISHTGTWEKLTESAREHYVKHARAVLMAVREPEPNEGAGEIYSAGFEAMFDAKFKDEYPMMSCGWEAMIDAILAEKA